MIHSKDTVKERWDAVVMEYSKKSAYAQTDLRAKFLAMRCPDKGNPREFLEGLRVKREELSQAGVVIDEKDYFSVIISSLPFSLSNFASNQLAATQFSTRKITPDDLLSMLLEESDHQRAQFQHRRGNGKGKDKVDKALSAGQSSKPSKGKGKKNHNIVCWNCDEKGHIFHHCKKPKKPKKSESDGKQVDGIASSSGTANAVEAGLDSEDEGA